MIIDIQIELEDAVDIHDEDSLRKDVESRVVEYLERLLYGVYFYGFQVTDIKPSK